MSGAFADKEAARAVMRLDGDWEFAPDDGGPAAAGPRGGPFPETIRVPGCWQAQGRQCTIGWYRRRVEIPAEWRGRLVWLTFGGVSYVADVWIGDRHVLTHEGLL